MIVLLRHCERDMNNQMFDSLLLEEGLLNSETNVVNQLEKYEFDYIYQDPRAPGPRRASSKPPR